MNLQVLLKSAGLTITQLAVLSGLSRSTVSKILSGKYDNHTGKEHRDLLERILSDKIAAGRKTPSFMTGGQKLILAVLIYTLEDKEFSIITGPSGTGKSHACHQFTAENPRVMYYKMVDGMSAGDIIDMMLESLGSVVKGHVSHRFKRLLELIHEEEVNMIIADEVDLFTKSTQASFLRKLSIFREIWETGIPVAIIGLPELEKQIRESEETYIYSRIGYSRRLKTVESKEMREFWKAIGGNPDEDGVTDAIRKASGNAWMRTMLKIYNRSKLVGVKAACNLIFE